MKSIKKDSLGDRMKKFYESRTKIKLIRRTPVIIRIDGKAFHTLTREFEKPFDPVMVKAMQDTMKYLCENIQGCVLGYTQSDEITLVLVDYNKLETDAWFDYDVQKLCSVSASMATFAFNRNFTKIAMLNSIDRKDYTNAYSILSHRGAMFDARCFNVPVEEVTNCIFWRQQDATRNSIQAVGRAYFSHKELQGLNTDQIQELLFSKQGVNWNDFPTHLKRGSCCIKKESGWCIDNEIPIFKEDSREYIEKLINY